MQKTLLITAICLSFGLAVPAFAQDTSSGHSNQNNNNSQSRNNNNAKSNHTNNNNNNNKTSNNNNKNINKDAIDAAYVHFHFHCDERFVAVVIIVTCHHRSARSPRCIRLRDPCDASSLD